MDKTTWIEVLPTQGAFIFEDSAKMRRVAGEQVTVKSDEAGLSIKCMDPDQAQEIITLLRKQASIAGDYDAWIIDNADWQNWAPEKEDRKPISIPGRGARRSRKKNQENR